MPTPSAAEPTASRLRRPSWGGSIGVFVVGAGWLMGLRPLGDNSFLTHLATGRLILDTGAVPSSDPYTFTAAGEPWVVQSWLVSLAYASAEQIAGLDGVRVLVGALAATLAGLAWTLLRPANGVVIRLFLVATFLAIGAGLWAERPFVVGLIGLALLLLAMDERLDPRWLLPIGWVWVNAHGSFPLGIVLLMVAALGQRLDGRSWARDLACLRWIVPGMLLGAVGPLGPRVLLFPLELLQRQELLAEVIEWRAPTFDTLSQRLFILQLVVAIVLIARRPSYRSALIVGVFSGAALLGARNLTVASLVMLPVMAAGLTDVGALSSLDRPRAARIVGLVAVGVVAVLTFARLDESSLNLNRYPVGSLAYVEEMGIDTREIRLAGPDFAGNLIDFVYGPEERTFYDDRFDMFPEDVSQAHLALVRADASFRSELDRLDIDLVTVLTTSGTAQVLIGDPAWRVVYLDDRWTLVCRRGADLAGELGRC